VFRDPVVLRHLCEEEAEAGWILLENSMTIVRFKCPMALRYTDTPIPVNDPYLLLLWFFMVP